MNNLSNNFEELKMTFKVLIKKDEEDSGYNISCPALPGCHSQGDTIEEALENIKDAIKGSTQYLMVIGEDSLLL